MIWTCGLEAKFANLPELRRVVEKILERCAGVERPEVVVRHLKRLVDPLLDRDRRYDNDELGEAIAPVELKNRTQVDVRLAGTGFHLHGEVAGVDSIGRRQAVTKLHFLEVRKDLIVEQRQPVAGAPIILGEVAVACGCHRSFVTVNSVRQISWPRNRSHTESTACSWKIKVGFETKLHHGAKGIDSRNRALPRTKRQAYLHTSVSIVRAGELASNRRFPAGVAPSAERTSIHPHRHLFGLARSPLESTVH